MLQLVSQRLVPRARLLGLFDFHVHIVAVVKQIAPGFIGE